MCSSTSTASSASTSAMKSRMNTEKSAKQSRLASVYFFVAVRLFTSIYFFVSNCACLLQAGELS